MNNLKAKMEEASMKILYTLETMLNRHRRLLVGLFRRRRGGFALFSRLHGQTLAPPPPPESSTDFLLLWPWKLCRSSLKCRPESQAHDILLTALIQ